MAEQTNDKTNSTAPQAAAAEAPKAPAAKAAPGQLQVRWDDTNMATSYANVVNAASTREEVTLFFGTNQTWNVAGTGEVKVQLTNRIVVNPYAAKRLRMLLDGVLTEYEKRFGSLDVDPGNGAA
jgi:hypothetical protein